MRLTSDEYLLENGDFKYHIKKPLFIIVGVATVAWIIGVCQGKYRHDLLNMILEVPIF
jgi:hypothetical protein